MILLIYPFLNGNLCLMNWSAPSLVYKYSWIDPLILLSLLIVSANNSLYFKMDLSTYFLLLLLLSPQSCLTLCELTDSRPSGSTIPGISPGKNTGGFCFLLSYSSLKKKKKKTQTNWYAWIIFFSFLYFFQSPCVPRFEMNLL